MERAFGANPLYVLFEGVKRPEAELKKYATIASVDEEGRPVTNKTYHVRVRLAGTLDPVSKKEVLVDPKTGKEVLAPANGDPKPRKGLIWIQADNGDVLDELPAEDDVAKDFSVEKAIVESLFNEWKARYLAEYLKRGEDQNQAINVRLFVDAVTVEKDVKTGQMKTEPPPAGSRWVRQSAESPTAVGSRQIKDSQDPRPLTAHRIRRPTWSTKFRPTYCKWSPEGEGF
jgi:hypothetical protein